MKPQLQFATALIAASLCAACMLPATALADNVVRITNLEVPLMRSPDIDGEVIRTGYEGEEFICVTSVKDFYLVKDIATEAFLYLHFSQAEVILDYVPEKMLISGQMQPPEEEDLSYWNVSLERVPMDRPRTKPRHGMLTASNGKQYPAKYDYNAHYSSSINGSELVRDARKFLGTKYVLGGTDFDGIDCSGLTKVCLARQGIDLEHRSSLQALEGRYIPHTDLEPGDLVYFRDDTDVRYLSHVGIYIGGGKFIHASQSAGEVVITSLSHKYFKSHYAFARRM